MTTIRLYHLEPQSLIFEAHVLERREQDGVLQVRLDQTAFYAESGGQPADCGTLGGVPVLDVQEEDSAIWHTLAEDPGEGKILGEVDASRRQDHSEQHSGQHILSQSFLRVAGLGTIGFHMGDDSCTIDLKAESISPEVLRDAAEMASLACRANLPVVAREMSREDADQLGLRRPTGREGLVRIVEIRLPEAGGAGLSVLRKALMATEDGCDGAFDRSACGGTHVSHTGEVGQIAILRTERIRGNTRVHFICGGRCERLAAREHGVLQEVITLLSTGLGELPGKVEGMIGEKRQLERESRRLREEALAQRVPQLVEAGRLPGGISLVALTLDSASSDARLLCRMLLDAGDGVAAVVGSAPGGVLFVGAGPATGVDSRDAVARASEVVGGKGGGREDFAQLGGIPTGPGTMALAVEAARSHLASILIA